LGTGRKRTAHAKNLESRRGAKFVTPIPKPKKRKAAQKGFVFDEVKGLSTEQQQLRPDLEHF
jgi:type III restriction enzyme